MLKGYRSIALYITDATRFDYSDRSVRHLTHRAIDPLPVERFGRRVFVEEEALDAWIKHERERGREPVGDAARLVPAPPYPRSGGTK